MSALPRTPSRRRAFVDALTDALGREAPGSLLGLIVLRVSHLHELNIHHGYEAADEVVAQLRARLGGALRDCDTAVAIEDAAFALILPGLQGAAQVELAASRVLAACRGRHELGGQAVTVPVALGAALAPTHANSAQELLRCAEIALGQARDNPAGFGLFDGRGAQAAPVLPDYVLEGELADAVDEEQLFLCLQPKLDLRTGTLAGAEALLRWRRASGDLVSPDVFIPVAERNGLIVNITLWSLNAALRASSEYFDRFPDFSVAVNLSPVALGDPDIFEFVTQAAHIWCSAPGQLTLEITEGALVADPAAAMALIEQFHRESIRLSIDDFGTGYSSLSQLGRLAVGELKIDKSFVFDLTKSARNVKIVRSIIDLAHNFDMTVVAEGIEDAQTLQLLTELGCDYGQGYFIGRPMTLEAFERWVEAGARPGQGAQG